VRHNVRNCVRCGGAHEKLEFKALSRPSDGFQLWAFCPATGEPSLVRLGGGAHTPSVMTALAAPPAELPPPAVPPSGPNLVTVLTADYVPGARPFLASLARVRRARCWCVCLGFKPGPLAQEFRHVTFRTLPWHPSASHGMLQHGRWLDALPEVSPDDVCVQSDADVIVQRDFTAAELAHLTAYDGDTFGAGPCAGPDDTLGAEAARIGLADPGPFDGAAALRVYCCGLLAAKASTWRRLQALYEERCGEFYARAAHRSRCQWLTCWCLHRLGLKVDVLGYEFTCHGHFGVPPGVELVGAEAFHRGNKILFRHALRL
jgi:hypothetical protein